MVDSPLAAVEGVGQIRRAHQLGNQKTRSAGMYHTSASDPNADLSFIDNLEPCRIDPFIGSDDNDIHLEADGGPAKAHRSRRAVFNSQDLGTIALPAMTAPTSPYAPRSCSRTNDTESRTGDGVPHSDRDRVRAGGLRGSLSDEELGIEIVARSTLKHSSF